MLRTSPPDSWLGPAVPMIVSELPRSPEAFSASVIVLIPCPVSWGPVMRRSRTAGVDARAEEVGGVGAAVAVGDVVARTHSQAVLAGPTRQRVVAGTAVEKPAPVAVDQNVVARAAEDVDEDGQRAGETLPGRRHARDRVVTRWVGEWRDLAGDPDRVLPSGAAQADVGVGARPPRARSG